MKVLSCLNCSHDGSACLVIDNRVVAFIEEERLTRVRHAYKQGSIESVKWCLDKSNLSLQELDWAQTDTYPERVGVYDINGNIFDDNHHIYHAWGAYAQSGYDDASILVIDGDGNDKDNTSYCIVIFSAVNDNIKVVRYYTVEGSLGHFYSNGSLYCGLRQYIDGKLPFTNSEGKLMSLAQYGKTLSGVISPITINTQTGKMTLSKLSLDTNKQKMIQEYLQEDSNTKWSDMKEVYIHNDTRETYILIM